MTPVSIPPVDILNSAGVKIATAPAFTATKYNVYYSNAQKIASVGGLHPKQRRPLVLWSGADYDAAGQFTDAQVDARVNELLGADPVATIIALINPPSSRKPIPAVQSFSSSS